MVMEIRGKENSMSKMDKHLQTKR